MKERWQNAQNLQKMTPGEEEVDIKTTEGNTLVFDNKTGFVKTYNGMNCPSYFKRDRIQGLFANLG